MIVLDENVPDSQCRLLRSWRIRARQIGHEVGRRGMRDGKVHFISIVHAYDRINALDTYLSARDDPLA